MPKPLSPEAFTSIQAQALLHIMKGGGIVPDDGGTDIEDAIGAVASEHFGADEAADEFTAAIAALDDEARERVCAAMWLVVARHQYGAFTFGAAVAMQLRGRPAPRRGSTRAKKGGRS